MRLAVTAAMERSPFQSGWRSASHVASAARQLRSSIRPAAAPAPAAQPAGADRIGEEQRRVLMQAGLVALEGEDIVRAFVDDAPGDPSAAFVTLPCRARSVGGLENC